MTAAEKAGPAVDAIARSPQDAAPPGLPDVIACHLSVLFCGLNPGLAAAAKGHHFMGRGNRFWRVLHCAGFTPAEMAPHQDRLLLDHRCGLTTVVERPTRRADLVLPAEFEAAAAGFERKIRHYAPGFVAFLGKAAYSALYSRGEVEWGLQPTTIFASKVWILPNPSGRNRAFSLDRLTAAYRALHAAACLGSRGFGPERVDLLPGPVDKGDSRTEACVIQL